MLKNDGILNEDEFELDSEDEDDFEIHTLEDDE